MAAKSTKKATAARTPAKGAPAKEAPVSKVVKKSSAALAAAAALDAALKGGKGKDAENANAKDEAQPTVAATKTRSVSGETTLSKYFREMSVHNVLTQEEELAIAQEVERVESAYWQALLSNPTCLPTVLAVIESHIDLSEHALPELAQLKRYAKNKRPTKIQRDRYAKVSYKLGKKLRQIDGDRVVVDDADKAVHRLAGEYADECDIVGDRIRITEAFKRYLSDVRKARRKQMRVKNQFVSCNLRLVVSIARRYNRGRLPLVDLIQEGNIGLMKAVERFDHTRGFRFSTYASWWIRHAISRALADKGRAVRIPVHMIDTYNRVARATQQISARMGRAPTTEELMRETGLDEEKLSKVKTSWAETPFSLDRTVNEDDGRKFIDFLEDEDRPSPYESVVSNDWSAEVRRLLGTLSSMEARIIRWRFGIDDEDELTLKEIGDKYNLSRERIRQLQEQALTKIRKQLQA